MDAACSNRAASSSSFSASSGSPAGRNARLSTCVRSSARPSIGAATLDERSSSRRAQILKLLRGRGLLDARGKLFELLRKCRITRGSRRQALDLRPQLGEALCRRRDAGGEIVEPRSELVELLRRGRDVEPVGNPLDPLGEARICLRARRELLDLLAKLRDLLCGRGTLETTRDLLDAVRKIRVARGPGSELLDAADERAEALVQLRASLCQLRVQLLELVQTLA